MGGAAPAASAPRCAAPSMPAARPDTIATPAAARSRPSSNATPRPVAEQRRVPTMATRGPAITARSPWWNTTAGGSTSAASSAGYEGDSRHVTCTPSSPVRCHSCPTSTSLAAVRHAPTRSAAAAPSALDHVAVVPRLAGAQPPPRLGRRVRPRASRSGGPGPCDAAPPSQPRTPRAAGRRRRGRRARSRRPPVEEGRLGPERERRADVLDRERPRRAPPGRRSCGRRDVPGRARGRSTAPPRNVRSTSRVAGLSSGATSSRRQAGSWAFPATPRSAARARTAATRAATAAVGSPPSTANSSATSGRPTSTRRSNRSTSGPERRRA